MLRERYPTRPWTYSYRCRRIELPDDLRKGKRRASGKGSVEAVAVPVSPLAASAGGLSAQANESSPCCNVLHTRKGTCHARIGRDALP